MLLEVKLNIFQFGENFIQKSHKDLITIIDRYSYDRYVRWVNLKKPLFQRFGAILVCYLLKKPTKCFILTDDPERIYGRKRSCQFGK